MRCEVGLGVGWREGGRGRVASCDFAFAYEEVGGSVRREWAFAISIPHFKSTGSTFTALELHV